MSRSKTKDETALQFETKKDYKGMLVREMPGCWSMLLGCDSKVLYSTPFAMDIIGVNDKDLVDQNLRAHIHEADVGTYDETIKQLLEQRLDVECIVRFRHAQSKAFRFVELRATPYSATGDSVVCIVASGKLYPSLYVDVLQTIMDTKLENERLRRLLEQEPSEFEQEQDPSSFNPQLPIGMPSFSSRTGTGASQDSGSADGKKKRNKKQRVGLICAQCCSTNSPEWRKGPNRAQELCNACGLKYAKSLKPQAGQA